jgi:hypothetical protein
MVFKLDAIASIGSAVALVIHEPAGGNTAARSFGAVEVGP